MFVDPDGMQAIFGDFIDEDGKIIGNDGINDGKVYVLKTTETKFDSKVASAGISNSTRKETTKFIQKNSGNTEAFKQNSLAYENSVEIEGSVSNRKSMVDIVSGKDKDNGRGGTESKNNKEYGGIIDSNLGVVEQPASAVADPSKVASISFYFTIDENTKSTFHSHSSGFVEWGTKSDGNTISYGQSGKYSFNQAPSETDIKSSKHSVNYVFARGTGKVYIYNSSGVIAILPMKNFTEFK